MYEIGYIGRWGKRLENIPVLELLDFFACILQCFYDGDEMEHAPPLLPCFFGLLKEEYLW